MTPPSEQRATIDVPLLAYSYSNLRATRDVASFRPQTSTNLHTMVITTRVRTTFFVPTSTRSHALIRLPPSVVGQYETKCVHSGRVIATIDKPPHRANLWSSDEHERFLHGLELFPNGPWKEVAAIVATKTTRQTMTHAQKYRQKIERRLLEKPRRSKPRLHARSCSVSLSVATDALERMDRSPLGQQDTRSHVQRNNVVDVSTMAKMVATSALRSLPSSPMRVSDDIIDSDHFDRDFEALLETLL